MARDTDADGARVGRDSARMTDAEHKFTLSSDLHPAVFERVADAHAVVRPPSVGNFSSHRASALDADVGNARERLQELDSVAGHEDGRRNGPLAFDSNGGAHDPSPKHEVARSFGTGVCLSREKKMSVAIRCTHLPRRVAHACYRIMRVHYNPFVVRISLRRRCTRSRPFDVDLRQFVNLTANDRCASVRIRRADERVAGNCLAALQPSANIAKVLATRGDRSHVNLPIRSGLRFLAARHANGFAHEEERAKRFFRLYITGGNIPAVATERDGDERENSDQAHRQPLPVSVAKVAPHIGGRQA